MRRLSLALALTVLLLLTVGVATATASPPAGQSSGQLAGSEQAAGAAGGTAQKEASNSSQPIRVLSPGDDGDLSQTNEASSDATAANWNSTKQTAGQLRHDNLNGTQVVGQSATNAQDAAAIGLTVQKGASNENAPVQVLSPGSDGSVSQANEASSDATAGNANATEQTSEQEQAGGKCRCKDSGGGAGTQVVGQSASNDQSATALSATEQESPSNSNVSIRVLSPGDDGDVSQTNEATSDATAANTNGTQQTAGQLGGAGGTQVIGQSADSDQDALAAAATEQKGAENENVSIRVLSPGKGGSVTQSNVASSNATAANANRTEQTADQEQTGDSCKCGSAGSQVIGQSAANEQGAAAISATKQEKPSNTNVSIRVLSPGDDGDVSQSNVASSNAVAANSNGTKQTAEQSQGADSCRCRSTGGAAGTQVIGQSAANSQDAFALGFTVQKGASNENAGIRVLSPGNGGSVSQSNNASSNASAGNSNWTGQDAAQTQEGSCKCGGAGTQIIGQSATSEQKAAALSATIQLEPSNTNTPIRVLSPGSDGDVSQSNDASSNAVAGNRNGTKQTAEQSQSGSGVQVIGQASQNGQFAAAAALTAQLGARNENAPVRVLSPGNGGSVSQANNASSNAVAGNSNWTGQNAEQLQGGDSRGNCCGAGFQVIGQSSSNWQGAKALAVTLQVGAKPPCRCGENKDGIGNRNAPTRVLSPGDDGAVRQSNDASSNATAANWNWTDQTASQIQDRPQPCRCKAPNTGFQVIGQQATNSQFAAALALTLQLDALNRSAPERKASPGKSDGLSQTEKDAAGDASGSRTATDQSRSQVER